MTDDKKTKRRKSLPKEVEREKQKTPEDLLGKSNANDDSKEKK